MRGACLVLFLATARGSPIDYDHEQAPGPRVSRVAAVVRAANHRALERLRREAVAPACRRRRRRRAGALCAPPFPPHAREAVRWFHVPRCGTTFFNALVRYVCPSSAVAWRATVGEAALEPAHLMAATCGAATGSDARRRRRGARRRRRFAASPSTACAIRRRARRPSTSARGRRARRRRRAFRRPLPRPGGAAALGLRLPPARVAHAAVAARRRGRVRRAHALARHAARAHGVAACAREQDAGRRALRRPSAQRRPANARRPPRTSRATRTARATRAATRSRARAARGSSSARSRRRARAARFRVGGVGERRRRRRRRARAAARACCARPRPFEPAGAVRAFRFVGLVELWNASVCLFHRRLGLARAPPRAGAAPAPSASIDPREFANPPGFHAGEGARARRVRRRGAAARLRRRARRARLRDGARALRARHARRARPLPEPPWASDVDSGAGF